MDKQEERIMANIPIASSFKGILRIAHIQELNGNDNLSDDNFFNTTYYNKDWEEEFNLMNVSGSSNSGKFYGYSKASSAFEGKVERYNSSDVYVDKKLPVTDSVGNFLNFYVSPEGSLFGAEETNAGNSLEPFSYNENNLPLNYPNLKTDKLDVGIEYKRNSTTKCTFSGQLNIDKNLKSKTSEIIFNNKFDHTFADSFVDIQYDGDDATRANYKINEKSNLRTIYSFTNETPKEYDVLMHHQENFDKKNYDLSEDSKKNVDSFVDIVNLKEYVKERINKFKAEMTVELPPGTVIWQYIDMNKWYCQTGTGDYDEGYGSDYLKYCGHRPAMVPNANIKTYSSIMFDRTSSTTDVGVLCKDVNKLVLPTSVAEISQDDNNYENTLKTTQISISTVKEIIPAYKKNFLLCDGSKYTIKTKMSSNDYHDILSFERLIDLFYVIGFEYTDPETMGNVRNLTKNANDEYVIASISVWKTFASDLGRNWKDMFYERAMGCILAYKKLREDIQGGGKGTFKDGKYDYATAKAWLAEQNIPEEYAFNTVFYDGEEDYEGIEYTYADGSSSAVLKLGKEVKTFSDDIAYPYNKNNLNKRAKLIDTFEIKKILEYFTKDDAGMINMENEFNNIFAHTFQVPNFSDKKNNMGVFIGSSAAESIFGEGGLYESKSSMDSEHLGHRHGIYAGGTSSTTLSDNPDYYPVVYKNYGNYSAFSLSSTGEGVESAEVPSYYIQEIDSNNLSTFGYATNPITGVKTIVKNKNNATFRIETASSDATTITEAQDPRCVTMEPDRGLTSPPIEIEGGAGADVNIKYSWAAGNIGSTKAEFFSPECVQMLPLISL